MLNTQIANVSDSNKDSISIDLSLPAFAGRTLYLSYLTADGADAFHNVTWNGFSYEISGDGLATAVDSTQHTVSISGDGRASVPLRASQAVVANIGSIIGSEAVNATACAALAMQFPASADTGNGTSAGATGPSTSSKQLSAASATSLRPQPASGAFTVSLQVMALGLTIGCIAACFA